MPRLSFMPDLTCQTVAFLPSASLQVSLCLNVSGETSSVDICVVLCSFFRAEYALNHKLGTMHMPHIALLDGIVMGGGAGVSCARSVQDSNREVNALGSN